MRLKVMLLIGTDGCCWIPVCISAFVSYAGYRLPDTMYIASATILLPINSVLNPLIYSGFGYGVYKKYFAKAPPPQQRKPISLANKKESRKSLSTIKKETRIAVQPEVKLTVS